MLLHPRSGRLGEARCVSAWDDGHVDKPCSKTAGCRNKLAVAGGDGNAARRLLVEIAGRGCVDLFHHSLWMFAIDRCHVMLHGHVREYLNAVSRERRCNECPDE